MVLRCVKSANWMPRESGSISIISSGVLIAVSNDGCNLFELVEVGVNGVGIGSVRPRVAGDVWPP